MAGMVSRKTPAYNHTRHTVIVLVLGVGCVPEESLGVDEVQDTLSYVEIPFSNLLTEHLVGESTHDTTHHIHTQSM